jgi:hypothetical protein
VEMYDGMETDVPRGAAGWHKPIVQLLGGSPRDPLGGRGSLNMFRLGAAWRTM